MGDPEDWGSYNQGFSLLLQRLYGDDYKPAASGGTYLFEDGGNSIYPFIAYACDPIMNGPFGNLTGMNWSEDASGSVFVKTPPGAIVYSQAYKFGGVRKNNPGELIETHASLFRDPTYNFVYISDGGWMLGTGPAGAQNPGEGFPAWNTGAPNYTPGTRMIATDQGLASNSIFFANWLAWAMNQAVSSGYNRDKY
jgi:hypothetical protein